ncbi:MAG: methyltransferase domain-containing protein [Candidatus Obscuribacterales bacterium]|jgi:glycosyltransferase involved in cell wall biosynthesis/SAM-dependent methyltransferase
MYIVMMVGGLEFNGDTLKTKSLGGSETAGIYVAKELAAQGHRVTIFTNSQDTGVFDGVKYEWAGVPDESMPLGDRFTFYAENTPHDVLIIQRHPRAFERKWASKINLWWLHDLALYRTKDLAVGQMWNIDKILCVSEYHKAQVAKVYGIPAEMIAVVNNGVDLALYTENHGLGAHELLRKVPGVYNIFYSSRPERGLFNLVKPDGIMERLKDDNVHLHVCGYENTTPQMKAEYEYLWSRCKALPNVTNHGALTKQELAALQKACDAWVYPTEFEEVSCITAMEAMAAGCVGIASDVAALSETCADSGSLLMPLKDGKSDIDQFVITIRQQQERNPIVLPNRETYRKKFTWARSAESIMEAVRSIFATANPVSLMHHFLRHSDIKAFEAMKLQPDGSAFVTEMLTEYAAAYRFYRENDYAKHYADYYQYEKDRGVNYGPEDVSGTTRFQYISNLVSALPAGSRVLDYGCAHGHYTVALAARFPQLTFVGADIAQSNLDTAAKWAEAEGLTNISFVKVDGTIAGIEQSFLNADFIIAAEVIEHVGDAQGYVDALADCLRNKDSQIVITVPYGPWEAQGYREHGYWRAHLHHFERADLQEMLGHHPGYKVVAAPSGQSQFHTPLGSYIVTFNKPTEPSREIDYARKISETMPDQTVTCCMIVKDAEADVRRCLNSVMPHVQEFIIGMDAATRDSTDDILREVARKNPLVGFKFIDLEPVRETGFAAARNATLAHAAGDWILWIDSDETLSNGAAMHRVLRNSMHNGFAVKQHHFSADPAGIIKVDMPCRLFRNHKGIQFFGAVHEHPEIKVNEGLGPVSMMGGTEIIHFGYTSEKVRRKRFSRNLPLLERDRKELPERLLGKFLWLRDLAQLTQYEIEANQLNLEALPNRIEDGIKLWLELLDSKNFRLVLDALPYYSQLAIMRGGGLDFSFALNANWMGEAKLDGVPKVEGYFADKAHAMALMNGLLNDKLPEIDRRYL